MKKLVQMLLITVVLSTMANLKGAEKYALLITGVDTGDGKEMYNHPDGKLAPEGVFWNDTYLMWEELVYEKGYKDENVYILFRDGQDQYNCDFIADRYNPWERHRIRKITDYAATKENLELVIEKLKTECTKDDFLLTYVNCHGGSLDEVNEPGDVISSDVSFSLYEGSMHDTTFARLMNKIPSNKKVYMMQNCFSGGFVNDLEGENSIVHTSIGLDVATFADDSTHTGEHIPYLENELNGAIVSHHGEFNFHNYCALSGKTPSDSTHYNNEPLPTGVVSFQDVYEWELVHQTEDWGTPQYSDPGRIANYTSLEYPTLLKNPVDDPFSQDYDEPIRGIIGVTEDVVIENEDPFDPYPKNVIIDNDSEITMLKNKTISVNNYGKLDIGAGSVLEGQGNNEIYIGHYSTVTIESSTIKNVAFKMEGEGKLNIKGDVNFENCKIEVMGVGVIFLNTDANMFVNASSELIIKGEAGRITANENSAINVTKYASFVAEGKSYDYIKMKNNYNNGNWRGIICHPLSNIDLKFVKIEGADYAVNGSPVNCKITDSIIENCDNGISLTNSDSYDIKNNIITGNQNGSGITLVEANGNIFDNTITDFSLGLGIISSSPLVLRNTISGNSDNGIVVLGNSIPQLSYPKDMIVSSSPKNNTIENNGNSQIFLAKYGNIYMNSGYNNIIRDAKGTSFCVATDGSHRVLTIEAENNYWGSAYPADKFFSISEGYNLDYEPYSNEIFPHSLISASTKSKLLSKAISKSDNGNYAEAKKAYETLIAEYPNSSEAYVALAKLPENYLALNLSNELLSDLYDEKLADPVWEDKFYIKGMTVKNELISSNYDTALVLAEEMRANADSEDQELLSDIDIAIAEAGIQNKAEDNSGKHSVMMGKVNGYLKRLLPSEDTKKGDVNLPSMCTLEQNYPNPFNPSTAIKFSLPQASAVKVKIFNANGAEIATLLNGNRNAGYHTVKFNGSKFTSGIYFYSLEANGRKISMKKMMLIK